MTNEINLSLTASNCSVETHSTRKISVDIENADKSEILEHFTIEEIISHYGDDVLLDSIGQDRAIEHFEM